MENESPPSRLSKAWTSVRTFYAVWGILFLTVGYLVLDHYRLFGLDGVDKNELFASFFIACVDFGLYLFMATRESVETLVERNKELDDDLVPILNAVREHVGKSDENRPSLDARFLKLETYIAELNQDVRRITCEHERIMFPHAETPKRHIIGVDHYDGDLPTPRERPSGSSSKWAITYSVLRYRWLQDLLFDTTYLTHIVKSKDASKEEHKLLIIDDQSRFDLAVRAYISLTGAIGIKTHLVTEYEYELFLESILNVLGDRKEAAAVRTLMEGHPELSLTKKFDEAVESCLSVTNSQQEVLFRHKGDPDGDKTEKTVGAFKLVVVALFLHSFRTTNGVQKDKRVCVNGGGPVLNRILSGHKNLPIDLLSSTYLKKKWQEAKGRLDL